MEQVALPRVFHELIDDPWSGPTAAALRGGQRPVGFSCSFVPEPLLAVEGLFPVRVRAAGATPGTPMADTYLSSVLCPYTRSLLEFALEGRFDPLQGWVLVASCDHLRRLADNLEYLCPPPFLHVLDAPNKRGEAAVGWYEEELRRLADGLAEHFEVDTGPAALGRAICRTNATRAALRAIGDLRKGPRPPISGTTFHTLMVAASSAPPGTMDDALEELLHTLEGRDAGAHRARLLVVGSQLDDPGWLGIIEAMGGLVVADRYCTGSLPGLEAVPMDRDNPLRGLARHVLLRTRCPRMMADFDLRLRDVLQTVRDYSVDGVVVETLKFCDLWGVESSALCAALREAGVPVLRVEREYARTGEGQLRTRVQAFLESMGR